MKRLILVFTIFVTLSLAACKPSESNGGADSVASDISNAASSGSSVSIEATERGMPATHHGDSSESEMPEMSASEPAPDSSLSSIKEEITGPSSSSEAPLSDSLSVSETAPAPAPRVEMSISSGNISGGVLADEYGMRGSQQKDGVPTLSPSITIKDAPDNIVCYAVIMRDPDSKPLCGYEWTHWLAANITVAEIASNASINNAANMIQGLNDFGATGYGGPTPPNKPHTYKITIYALDAQLDLKNGFNKDALLKAMEGHVLAQATLDAKYSN